MGVPLKVGAGRYELTESVVEDGAGSDLGEELSGGGQPVRQGDVGTRVEAQVSDPVRDFVRCQESGTGADASASEQGLHPLVFALLDVFGVVSPSVAVAFSPQPCPGLGSLGCLVAQEVVHGTRSAPQ